MNDPPTATALLLAWAPGIRERWTVDAAGLRRDASTGRAAFEPERAGHTLQGRRWSMSVPPVVEVNRVQWQEPRTLFRDGVAGDAAHPRRFRARARYQTRGGAETVLAGRGASRLEGAAQDLVALDDALKRLRRSTSVRARVVEIRFFSGLSCRRERRPRAPGVADPVMRDWRLAKYGYCAN